ncbi:MAG: hypothetical protein HOP29_06365 [Phycisphaerales bacterium]|nr:hypothetical protein [Phycisphaerales bacterium]
MTRHPFVRFLPCVLALAAPCWAETPFQSAADRPLDCLHIKLELNVDLDRKHVEGTATIDVAALRDVNDIVLDAVELETSGVTFAVGEGAAADVEHVNDGNQITITLPSTLKTGERARMVITYSVTNPDDGLHFHGPSEDEPDLSPVVWSQGESETNRYWFPCFDHPVEKQTTELIVTAKRGLEISANGRLISRREDPANATVTAHWLQDEPHSSYLVSLIVGEFHIERDEWRGKPIEYWVHPRFAGWALQSFRNTKPMLDFFSDRIGIEYPWDRYAQIACEGFGGGMENTSATTMGNRVLHDERALLDSDGDGLIAHEMAHQWWGDLLTCRDWAHTWLNEGFATYFEALWDEYALGDDEFRINMFDKSGSAMRGGKERPILDRAYESPDTMFDSRAYPKGAWVLHMVRKRIGDELFWKVLNTYGTRYRMQAVETVDLRKTIEDVTGRSFERFFYDWTERAGHPVLSVEFKWEASEKLCGVTVEQTQEGDPFHFPLTIEFRPADGEPVVVTRDITEKSTSFYYPMAEQPALVRVDPDYALLADIKEKKGRDLWKEQLLHDPDPVARIRAAQHFAEKPSDADRKLLGEALTADAHWGVQRELAEALKKAGGDIARDALIAGLKLENHKARRACVERLDAFAEDAAVMDALRPLVVNGDPSYSVEGAAIETYAKLEAPDARELLMIALSRDSWMETIRNSVLEGLGYIQDSAVVPVLIEWTTPKRPRQCRGSAISSLARLTTRVHLDDAAYQSIVDALAACLDDTGRWTRGAAVRAIGELAEPGKAKSALPALERLAARDPSPRLRRSVEKTLEAVRANQPAQVQLADVRKELKEALEHNDELSDRLAKLEASLTKGEDAAPETKAAGSGSAEPAAGHE